MRQSIVNNTAMKMFCIEQRWTSVFPRISEAEWTLISEMEDVTAPVAAGTHRSAVSVAARLLQACISHDRRGIPEVKIVPVSDA